MCAGEDLKRWRGEILLGVARAVQVAHDAGFCHNDIKGSNIAVQMTSEGPDVTLLDFGMAARRGESICLDIFDPDLPCPREFHFSAGYGEAALLTGIACLQHWGVNLNPTPETNP